MTKENPEGKKQQTAIGGKGEAYLREGRQMTSDENRGPREHPMDTSDEDRLKRYHVV